MKKIILMILTLVVLTFSLASAMELPGTDDLEFAPICTEDRIIVRYLRCSSWFLFYKM